MFTPDSAVLGLLTSQIEYVISSMCTSYRVLRLTGHNINVTLLDVPLSDQAPASPLGFVIRTRLIYNRNCKLASVIFHAFPSKSGKPAPNSKGQRLPEKPASRFAATPTLLETRNLA